MKLISVPNRPKLGGHGPGLSPLYSAEARSGPYHGHLSASSSVSNGETGSWYRLMEFRYVIVSEEENKMLETHQGVSTMFSLLIS